VRDSISRILSTTTFSQMTLYLI